MTAPDPTLVDTLAEALWRVDQGNLGAGTFRRHVAEHDLAPVVARLVAEAQAVAWDEGMGTGLSRAARQMGGLPPHLARGSGADNPYRAALADEGGA